MNQSKNITKGILLDTIKIEKTLPNEIKDDDIKILDIIKDEITLPKNDGSRGNVILAHNGDYKPIPLEEVKN